MRVAGISAERMTGGDLLAISCVGGGTEVKAVRAALSLGRPVKFRYTADGGWRGGEEYDKDGEGYRVASRAIGYRCHHLVAVTKKKSFMPSDDDESLWQMLKDTVTTPLLRSWVPDLRYHLKLAGRYGKPFCQGGIAAATASVNDGVVDEIVCRLVKCGTLRFKKGDK